MSDWGDWSTAAPGPPPAPTGADANKDQWGSAGGFGGWGDAASAPAASGSAATTSAIDGWGTSAPASGSGASAASNQIAGAHGNAWSRQPRIPRAYGGFDWWKELDRGPSQASSSDAWGGGGSGWGAATQTPAVQQDDSVLFKTTLPTHLQQQYQELRQAYSNYPGDSKLLHMVVYEGASRDVAYLPPRFPDSIYQGNTQGSRPNGIQQARPFDMIEFKKHEAVMRRFRAGGSAGDVSAGRRVPTVAIGLHGLQGKAAQMTKHYDELKSNAVQMATHLRDGLGKVAEQLRQAESLQLEQSRINRRLISVVSALDEFLLKKEGREAQALTDGERELMGAVQALESQLAERSMYEGRLEALHEMYRRSASTFAAGMSQQVEEAAQKHDRFLPEVARHLARHADQIAACEDELKQSERHVALMERELAASQAGARLY